MHVALFVCLLFSSKTSFFPLDCYTYSLSTFSCRVLLFLAAFLLSFIPNSPTVWSWFKGLNTDLLSFCLYSPWSLKTSFIPPCAPIVLCLTSLMLKCPCLCPHTPASSVIQVHVSACICSNCYLEFAVRGRLNDSWKDRLGEGERGLFVARTACWWILWQFLLPPCCFHPISASSCYLPLVL